MDTARIAELLEPFLTTPTTDDRRLSANDALYQHISTYIDLLLHWNARINLTAIRDPEQIVSRHFGESLFAARVLFPRPFSVPPAPSVVKDLDAPSVADLGSGAGFPGLPIKLWAPEISLTLIESNHKKTAFLREVARAITLTNVNIQNARAETLPVQSFDLVTLRAVERFEKILPVAAALLAPSGTLALLIGTNQRAEALATLSSLSWSDPVSIPQSKSRILAIAYGPAKP
jgi:16S rRNA (guanine527-N7)-methyltransferase